MTDLDIIQYSRPLHVIFMVCWFSGLFFAGRMFVYYKEAEKLPEVEKNAVQKVIGRGMRNIMYIIIHPSMLLTIVFGGLLMAKLGVYREGWFHFKILFVLGVIAYTIHCSRTRKKLITNTCKSGGVKLRLINEIPALLLIIIIFIVYLRDIFSSIWSLAVMTLLTIFIAGFVYLIRKSKKKDPVTAL